MSYEFAKKKCINLFKRNYQSTRGSYFPQESKTYSNVTLLLSSDNFLLLLIPTYENTQEEISCFERWKQLLTIHTLHHISASACVSMKLNDSRFKIVMIRTVNFKHTITYGQKALDWHNFMIALRLLIFLINFDTRVPFKT